LAAVAMFLVEATKNSFVVPNFVAVTKPFFRDVTVPERNFPWRKSY